MSHALDKTTVNRILHLHQVQDLSPQIIGQRFGFSTSRIHGVIRRAASRKLQASSGKPQASSALKKPQLNDIG
jgi:DNA-directed RNA polymerase specialized sigma24 family protein